MPERGAYTQDPEIKSHVTEWIMLLFQRNPNTYTTKSDQFPLSILVFFFSNSILAYLCWDQTWDVCIIGKPNKLTRLE